MGFLPRRPLLLLHPEARIRARIASAVQGAFHTVELGDWGQLREAVGEAPPGSVAVVDPYHGTEGDRPAHALQEILKQFPSAAVVAAIEPRDGRYRDVWELSRWGVAEVLPLPDERSPLVIRRRLKASQARPLRAFLAEELPPGLSGRARAIIEAAAEVVLEDGFPKDLCKKLGMSSATLNRWCRRAGLPTPRKQLQWFRVLWAAALLDDPGHTVFSVAMACGYSTDDSLRRAIRAVVPHPPTELREMGAFETVSKVFSRELSA